MFEEDDICSSFTLLLKGIQTETKVLKCVSQLRSLPPNDKLTEKIFDIEIAVQNIEKNLEDFNEFLSSEMTTCDTIEREIINAAEQQAKLIEILRTSLPQSLIDAVTASKVSLSDTERPVISQVTSLGYIYLYPLSWEVESENLVILGSCSPLGARDTVSQGCCILLISPPK